MSKLYSFDHNIMGINYKVNVDSLEIKKTILEMFKIELLNSYEISANLMIINSETPFVHADINSLIIKINQEKLSMEKLRIYIIQMVTRHASYMNLLNNGDIFLLHGSSIAIGNKALLFGDYFNNTGKTIGAISYLQKGFPLIEDEFTILDTRDMKLYGVGYMDTIHIKNTTKALFFKNLINQDKNFYSPTDFNSKKVFGNILQNIIIITNEENNNVITKDMQVDIFSHIILSNILKLIYPGFDRFDPVSRGNDILSNNYSELINELIYQFGHIIKEKIDFCKIQFEYRTKEEVKNNLDEIYFDIHVEGIDNVGKTSLINEIKHHVLKDTCTETITLKDYLFMNSAHLEQRFFNRDSKLIADDMFNEYVKLFNLDSDFKTRLFDRGYITAIAAINSRDGCTQQRKFKITKTPNIIISFQFTDLKEIQNIRKCKYDIAYLAYQKKFISEYYNEMNEVINNKEYDIVVTNYYGIEDCIQNAIISMKKTHILVSDIWRSMT